MRVVFMPKVGAFLIAAVTCLTLGASNLAWASTPDAATVWLQGQKAVAGDGTGGDHFGFSIAASGKTVIVGAPNAKVDGNANQGAAYVFTKSNGVWSEEQKLTASDGAAFDAFGKSVAIEGKTAFVSASEATINGHSQQGAVYVFTLKNGHWSQAQKLVASDGAARDELGWAMAVSGDTMVVSANDATVNGNANQGAAYVFTESNGSWSQAQKLTASDGAAHDFSAVRWLLKELPFWSVRSVHPLTEMPTRVPCTFLTRLMAPGYRPKN